MTRPIHIIGAGGIGVAMGYALANAGRQVTMVEKNAEKLEAGQQQGLQVEGHAPIKDIPFIAFDSWQEPDDALLLLCTKTFNNAEVLESINKKDLIIPVQNGYDELLDQQPHFGEAIASYVSECDRQRPFTRITREGELHVGQRKQTTDENKAILAELAETLKGNPLFEVLLVDDVLPYKRTKLMYNAAISPLAASAGVDNATLLSDKLVKTYFFKLILENYSILKYNNLELAKIGPFHPDTVSKILRIPGLPEIMAQSFKPSLRGTYCSMAPDMGSAQTEIEAYNGYLVKLAGNMPCPYNRAAVEMVRKITNDRLQPGYKHLFIMQRELQAQGINT